MKRYDLEYCGSGYSEHREMVENPEGDWVRWDDMFCGEWDGGGDEGGEQKPCKKH